MKIEELSCNQEEKQYNYTCHCGNVYKYKSGFYKHIKKCSIWNVENEKMRFDKNTPYINEGIKNRNENTNHSPKIAINSVVAPEQTIKIDISKDTDFSGSSSDTEYLQCTSEDYQTSVSYDERQEDDYLYSSCSSEYSSSSQSSSVYDSEEEFEENETIREQKRKYKEKMEAIDKHIGEKIAKITAEKGEITLGELGEETNIDMTSLIVSMLKESRALQELVLKQNETIQQQNKRIYKLAKTPKTVIKNNNTFNLVQFLNVECKNAMNFSDFVKNIKIGQRELQILQKEGFTKSLENVVIRELIDMEQTLRPLHCLDQKRKRFIIKDENKWEKDTLEDKVRILVTTFSEKYMKEFTIWQKNNPNWREDDDKYDIAIVMNAEIFRPFNSHYKDKIHNNVINQLTQLVIDKDSIKALHHNQQNNDVKQIQGQNQSYSTKVKKPKHKYREKHT